MQRVGWVDVKSGLSRATAVDPSAHGEVKLYVIARHKCTRKRHEVIPDTKNLSFVFCPVGVRAKVDQRLFSLLEEPPPTHARLSVSW